MTPLDVAWVGLGGGAGSLLRWWVGRIVGEHYRGDFPLGTFLINITGAFVIGYLSVAIMVDWQTRHGTALIAGMLTGFLGGYTTFSSMQLDAARLANKGQGGKAFIYLAVSTVVGLVAAWIGAALARVQG